MTRAERVFVALLIGQTALCGAIAASELFGACADCRRGPSPGLAGLLFYTALLVQALRGGVGAFPLGGAHFALGVHLLLAAERLRSGLPCLPCLAATAGSAALAVSAWACDRRNSGRALLLLPGAALVAALWSASPRAVAEAPAGTAAPLRITVFTQPDCAWCDELKRSVMPAIVREFGSRIDVVWRPASDLPALRKTPTIIVARGGADRPARVLEGLPSAEALREAVVAVEAAR